jgi:PAT family beta-lactamase induction signal transducer AmpG
MQYAIFSSIMTLFPKILGGYSGSIVEGIGYETFFLITAVIGLPVLLLILWINRMMNSKTSD